MSDPVSEKPITRLLAGVLGVPVLLASPLMMIYEPTLWQAWISCLIGGGLLTFVVWKGHAPGFLQPRIVGDVAMEWAPTGDEPILPWWQRAGLGFVIGAVLGGVETVFYWPGLREFTADTVFIWCAHCARSTGG